jgi:ACS family hexuronate transporter-like MFS transporter
MNARASLVGAIWFFQLANFLNRAAMSFAGPAIMASLRMSPDRFGVVLSSFGVGYVLAQIPGGLIADRLGAKLLMVISPLLWAVFTGATGLVAGLAGFVLVRVCLGLAEGVSLAPFYKIVGDNFEPAERARTMALCGSASVLAPVIGGPLIGAILATRGWPTVFYLMTVPALLAALLVYVLAPSGQRQRAGQPVADLASPRSPGVGSIARRQSFWLISLSYFAVNVTYWGYQGWMPSYLALQRHIDLKSVGPIATIPYAFAFFGILFCGWLDGRALHGRRPQLIAVAYLLAALFLLLAYQADTLALAVAGLSGAAFCLFGSIAPFGAIVLALAPPWGRATYAGVVNTIGQVGGIVAPAAIGFLVTSTANFSSGFALMIAGLILSGVALLGVRRTDEVGEHQPA